MGRLNLVGAVVLVVVSSLSCSVFKRGCWIGDEDALAWPRFEDAPALEEGDEFRVRGVYRAGWEFSLLAVAIGQETMTPSAYSSIEYCVSVTTECSTTFNKATDLPGDYVDGFSKLAYVDLVVRYEGRRGGFDCPLGRITVLRIVHAKPFTKAEVGEVAR
jgi:hypothetical protein